MAILSLFPIIQNEKNTRKISIRDPKSFFNAQTDSSIYILGSAYRTVRYGTGYGIIRPGTVLVLVATEARPKCRQPDQSARAEPHNDFKRSEMRSGDRRDYLT